jgi:hypothetical protein
LLEAWFEAREQQVAPKLLLDGREVMQLASLSPGPAVGALLEDLREAQAGGEIGTREEAEAFIRIRAEERKSPGSPVQG